MMRNVTRTVATVLALTAGVGMVSTAWAQRDARQATKALAVSFRVASTTPQAGFESVTVGSETVYVASRAALAGGDVVSSKSYSSRTGSDVDLTLTRDAADRLDAALRAQSADRLVAYAGGKAFAVGALEFDGTSARATMSDLTLAAAEQLVLATNVQAVPRSGPRITITASQPTIGAGESVTVDVFAAGVADLRSYQVKIVVSGGESGSVDVQDLRVDSQRADYVFGAASKFDAVDQIGHRLGGVLLSGSVDATASRYLGTVVLRASTDALGTFTVNVETRAGASQLANSRNLPVAFAAGSTTLAVGKGLRKRTPSR